MPVGRADEALCASLWKTGLVSTSNAQHFHKRAESPLTYGGVSRLEIVRKPN